MNASPQNESLGLGGLRFRQDIEWVFYPDSNKWVARDPIASSFFYFSDLEFAATKFLDGKNSIADVIGLLNKAFVGQQTTEKWLDVFVRKLRNAHLMLPSGPTSVSNASQSRRGTLLQWAMQLIFSPLSIRVPIFRPSEFSRFFRSLAIFLFHPVTILTTLFVSAISIFLVLNSIVTHPESIVFDVRQIQGDRWIVIFVSYLAVKSLHELGHVLACARWGAKCNEIGVLFLFFVPCLYCDTTDCWKLPSKWQRAAVGIAGLYVELMIASIAAIVWVTANDGLERTVAASVMLLCSLGTILVNGNPFFRYDGYYILSDVWGVPNLGQQSSMARWRIFVYCLGGRKWRSGEFDKSVWALAAFAVVSGMYRWFVLILVMWMVWTTLVPIGLGLLALLIFATTGVGILLALFRFLKGLLVELFTPMPIRVFRLSALMVVVAFCVYQASTLPIPGFVHARGYLDFGDKIPIYATETASVKFVSERIGTSDLHFRAGERMFELDCPEKKYELMNLVNEIIYTKSRIEILKNSSVNERSTSFELPPLLEIAKDLEAKRELISPELKALTQMAPEDGFFMPSPARVTVPLASSIDVRSLRSLIHPDTLNSTVEKGTLLGWYIPEKKGLFQVLVSEADMKSLRTGNIASCILDSNTDKPIQAEIVRLSPDPIEEIPMELLGDSFVVAKRNEKGMFAAEKPHYQVTLEAASPVSSNIKGSLVTVHFQLASRTLFEHLARYVRLTFKPSR